MGLKRKIIIRLFHHGGCVWVSVDVFSVPTQSWSSVWLKPIWRFLPPLELELDLKGSVTVIGKSALVEVAEIKSSSAKSRKGKGQLKSRAFVMRWALQQLCLEISEVTLAGRVLINNSDVSVAEQNYVDASGMSIFVHPM